MDLAEGLETFVCYQRIEIIRELAECVGLPELSEDLLRVRVTSSQFNEMWRKVLEKMKVGFVHYMSIVEIMADGQLSQVCSGCSKKIDLKAVELVIKVLDKTRGPTLIFYGSVAMLSLCGEPACFEANAKDVELLVWDRSFVCCFVGEELIKYWGS